MLRDAGVQNPLLTKERAKKGKGKGKKALGRRTRKRWQRQGQGAERRAKPLASLQSHKPGHFATDCADKKKKWRRWKGIWAASSQDESRGLAGSHHAACLICDLEGLEVFPCNELGRAVFREQEVLHEREVVQHGPVLHEEKFFTNESMILYMTLAMILWSLVSMVGRCLGMNLDMVNNTQQHYMSSTL